jgi:hypothetical protein
VGETQAYQRTAHDARGPEAEKHNMETNTNDQRELEALRFSSRASRAITTLEMQRKSIGREYGERVKKIKALILILQQRESLGQMSLDGVDAVEITPELRKLVYNPVGDLS